MAKHQAKTKRPAENVLHVCSRHFLSLVESVQKTLRITVKEQLCKLTCSKAGRRRAVWAVLKPPAAASAQSHPPESQGFFLKLSAVSADSVKDCWASGDSAVGRRHRSRA